MADSHVFLDAISILQSSIKTTASRIKSGLAEISILQSSIKTVADSHQDGHSPVFQFYKVRLKQRDCPKKSNAIINFNSTKFD